jgi:hypothetical protein
MGEFPCCRFAEQDPASGAELLCHHGILCRDVIGQQLRLRRGPDPGRLDDVLQAIGNAVQRAARTIAHDLCLGRSRALPGKLGGQGDKAHQLVVNRRDALQVGLSQLDRRQLALGDPARCLGDRDEMQLGTGHGRLLRREEFGRHEDVRRLVRVGAGTPDAPQHLLQVAISIDQLVEMLCAEFQPGS